MLSLSHFHLSGHLGKNGTVQAGTLTRDVVAMNMTSKVLREVTPVPDPKMGLPAKRYKHTAVLRSTNGVESLYLYGGRDEVTMFDDLWRLDIASFSVRPHSNMNTAQTTHIGDSVSMV